MSSTSGIRVGDGRIRRKTRAGGSACAPRTSGAAITVRAGNGFLYVAENEAGIPASALFHPVGGGVFSALNPRALATLDLRFDTDADGAPAALVFTGGEQAVAARRVP